MFRLSKLFSESYKEKIKSILPNYQEKSNVDSDFPFSKQELEMKIKKAHQQWEQACNYYQNVSEPELIDYASYKIKAAQRKYMYLLKQAQKFEEEINS